MDTDGFTAAEAKRTFTNLAGLYVVPGHRYQESEQRFFAPSTSDMLGLVVQGFSSAQKIGLALQAILYAVAGALHFATPGSYMKIMPPYIPEPLLMVRLSGLFEILGGLGLLVPATRRAAAWGLVALLVAVFPANLYMAMRPAAAGALSIPAVMRWGRLPLQALLIWWVLWCSQTRRAYIVTRSS